MDEITELADRMLEKYRRGEEPGLQDRLAWDGLTDAERDEFMALQDQRIAHGKERCEAIEAENRVLKELLRLQVRMAPGVTLMEALASGRIRILEVIRVIRAMPD